MNFFRDELMRNKTIVTYHVQQTYKSITLTVLFKCYTIKCNFLHKFRKLIFQLI